MAQYYQIQSLDDLKQIYADVQVLHVASDDVGASNHNRSQQMLLQDDQILLNDGQQVVYQTTAANQPQYQQQGTTHFIIGDDIAQQQQQQQQQQQPQHQQVMLQQHQTIEHHQQQQAQTQQQQHYQQQETQQPQVQMQQQDHQLQHVQQQTQQQPQPQQIYYTTDQILQQNTIVQHSPHAQQQQQEIQQQQQQQLHVQQQYQQQQQIVHQQHAIPSTQQVQVQQQPQQQQVVYRMQTQQQQQSPAIHQQTQMLNNAHVIVQQQPSGQQVIIQPQHPDMLMRQPMRIYTSSPHHNANRVIYSAQQPPQTHAIIQQSPQHQQQHIQLQSSPLHTQTRLVQTRVGPQTQQSQQGVVFHQIQNSGQKTVQQQQQLQIQQQPQLVSTTGVMRGGVRPKIPRGGIIGAPGLIPRMPAARAVVRPIISTTGAAGQTLKTPRPRSSATASGSTRARGGARGGRGGMAAGRGGIAASAAAASGMQIMGQPQQQQTQLLQQGKNITITSLNPQGVNQIYRQVVDKNSAPQQHQQLHMLQNQQRAQAAQHMRSPPIGTPPQTQIQSSPATSSSSGNFELDLEDSIQAVVVKKDQQKTVGTAIANPMGTTLTTYYTKEDDDKRYVHTQNGTCMTVTEFKKRIPNANPPAAPVGTMRSIIPMRAGGPPPNTSSSSPKLSTASTGSQVPIARVAPQKISQQVPQQQQTQQTAETIPQATASSVYKTSHNNYEIQTQHVLQNRSNQQMAEKDRNSAKMLVILVSGEQRLITFTLPRESCTVQDLLEQVGVPFDNTTTIQCVENPGANIDFVVTVGFSVMESASELISRAEQSLQLTRQPDNSSMAASAAAAGAAASSATSGVSAPTAAAAAYNSLAANTSAATAASASSAGVEEPTKDASASTSSSASNATGAAANKLAEEVPRKTIQGFFAICQSCGCSGHDHAKCERCKRVFLEPPKRVPVKAAVGNTAASDGLAMPRLSSDLADKKRSGDIIPRGSKGGVPYSPNTSGRGRGGAGSRGRTRSGRRNAEAEPVILTLSSDEEGDDDASSKASANVSAAISHTSGLIPMPYKPLAFEPMMPEKDETPIYAEFERGDITDLSNCTDKLSTTLQCKLIRIGGTMRFEPQETVTFTSKGIRIVAPLENDENKSFALHIHKNEVVKIIAHFSKTSDSMLCFYTLRTCAKYIKTSLNMIKSGICTDTYSYFDPNGPYQMRKIILQFDSISDQARNVIKSIWDFFDEISVIDAKDLLQRAAHADRQLSQKTTDVPMNTTTQLNPNEIRQLLIYPLGKGGISINTEDYMCLATDQYLNDIIIDFYLKWVHNKLMPENQREKTFVFSTFFYKRLTTLTRHQQPDKDVKQTAAQKRHARVQNWTKNVNLFNKDFIIIPINEQSHWFLAIICFPQLKGPVTFDTNIPVDPQQIKKQKGKKVSLQIGNTTITPLSKRETVNANVLAEVCGVGDEDSERDEAEGDDSDLASEDSDFENSSSATNTPAPTAPSTPAVPVPAAAAAANFTQSQAIKQPLILIFDSLAGASRSRVVATLRDYLSCEYKLKMGGDAAPHIFNKDNMPGHCVKVPQQNNFTDCGLYLLQYVEHFFKEPIRDYRLPIKQLSNWFDTITVTRKREEISVLLQKLMNENNGPNQKVILPEIPFPTLNGQLVEPPEGYNIEFEEGEMEEEAVEEEEDNSLKGGADTEMAGDENSQLIAKTTTAALVPTQGRKIVVKRRMQVPSGHSEASPSNPANARNSMVKIRKIEQ